MVRVLLLLLTVLLASTESLAKPSATAVRIGEHPDKTRFVLELSEEPSYRIFTLPDPVRVVIDLPELDWQMPSNELPASRGMIEALRYGLFAPGTSRVVLDMRVPVGVKSVLVLPPQNGSGYRLVIDLRPISREVFLNPNERRTTLSKKPLPRPQATAFPSLTPAPKGDPRPIIVIDAGHGGIDPGASSVSGAYEKDIVLAYALELRRQLLATKRYRVVLTREDDRFLRLRDRFARALDVEGGLFLSLHVNTGGQPKVQGASVYTLSETASDAEAGALARKENLADIIAGVNFTDQTADVSKILIDLAQRETMNLSKSFANMLVTELGETVTLLRNTHRFADFAVLKSPTVPSVLIEYGYISNRAEERRLLDPGYRKKVTGTVIRAIDKFFQRQAAMNRT